MPQSTHRLTRFLLILTCAAGIFMAPATASMAEDSGPTKLSLKAVGQTQSYFDLTMKPGQSQHLEAELGNHGTTPIAARTYAADAYTLYNGGFGAKDRNSTANGTTTWLSYPGGVLQLPAGRASTKAFTLTVPPGTPPGQYLTSIVLENDVPVRGGGSVSLNQIVRQAMAVSIRVPGPLQPVFTVGTASHKVTADHSVVSVGISNTGNANLKPAGELVVRDANGKTVSTATVAMAAFYAHTDTRVETTLGGKLQPGHYTAALSLTDPATKTTATATNLQFTVHPAEVAVNETASPGQLPPIMQDATTGPGLWIVAAAVILALAVTVLLIRRRTLRTRRTPTGSNSTNNPIN